MHRAHFVHDVCRRAAILTDPEDGEALTIDDIKSVDLSLPIGSPAYIPMGDTARRSYIATRARQPEPANICLRWRGRI